MTAAFEKEFAIPQRSKIRPLKGFEDGLINYPPGWVDDQKQPTLPPIENVSSLMTVGNENFKWTPEKKPKPDSNSNEFDSSWAMPFMKLRVLLCIIGAIPLKWRKPHTPSNHLLNSTMLYSIVVYSAISVSAGIAGADLISMLSNTDQSSDEQVMSLEMTIELVAYLLTPVLWIDSGCQAEGFEVWASLTRNFYRITGRKLVSRRPGIELAFILCVIFLPTLTYLIGYIFLGGLSLKFAYAPAYIHFLMVQCGLAFIWIGTCLTLGDVADDITSAFKESTEKHGATSEILVEYRRLWVMVRSVSDLMGEMISPLLLVTHTLVLITLFLYEGLVFINSNETLYGVAHLCSSVIFVIQLFFVCRASHYTAHHMKLPLEEVLDTLPVATLSTTAEREVIMFYLVENAKPAVTTLDGFVIVNKSLFSSMLAAVSTYLIVLMQFHQSSDGFSSRNTTVSFI